MNRILGSVALLTLAACTYPAANSTQPDSIVQNDSLQPGNESKPSVIGNSSMRGSDTAGVYSQAIAAYIQIANERDHLVFDTLFFGRHDDFPDIQLPSVIEKTRIVVLTSEDADLKRKFNENLVFINLLGWVHDDQAEFVFVTFFPGYQHRFDYFIDLKYNPLREKFELEKISFENYTGLKEGQPKRIAVFEDGRYVNTKSTDVVK